MGGELEDGALTVRASGDDGDVSGVVDGGDDTGCENDLLPTVCVRLDVLLLRPIAMLEVVLFEKRNSARRGTGGCSPGLANVDHVDTVRASLVDVRLHVHLDVLCTEVALGGEEHLDIVGGSVEASGKVGRGHLDCTCCAVLRFYP